MSLSVYEKLKDSIKKGGLSNNEVHHPSRAYERHFEGYVETAESVPGHRRSKSVRTYVDSYWVQVCSLKKRRWLRVLFATLYLISLPPFLYSASRMIDANTVWYITLPQALSLFALGWSAFSLYRYCTAPREMTVRQYRLAVTHFHRAFCFSWVMLALLSSTYLIYFVLSPEDQIATLLCAIFSLFSCFCILSLLLVERTIQYTEHENPLAGK